MSKATRTAKKKRREARAKLLFFLINLLLFFYLSGQKRNSYVVNFSKSETSLKANSLNHFFKVFCRTNEIQYPYWKNSIGCYSVTFCQQEKHKVHVLDSRLLYGADGRAYADVITKFFSINRFPFSKAMEASQSMKIE